MTVLSRSALLILILFLSIPLMTRAEDMPIEIKLKDDWIQKTKLKAVQNDSEMYSVSLIGNYKKGKKGKREPSFLNQSLSDEYLFSEAWKADVIQIIEDNYKVIWSCGEFFNGLKKEELLSYQKYQVPFLEGMSNGSDRGELEPVAFYHCGNDRYCIEYHGKRKEDIKEQELLVHEFWEVKFHVSCADVSGEAEGGESQELLCNFVCDDTKPITAKLKNTPMGEMALKELTGFNKEELLNECSGYLQ